METFSRSFQTLWVIFKNEFTSYFASPIIYLVGAIWLLIAGAFFSLSLVGFNTGQGAPSMAGMLQPMVFLMIFIAPALTMRLLSEERRSGTQELLLTSPVRDWEVIVAKWLGAWAVFSVFIIITFVYPILLITRGTPDVPLMITGYLGLWLMSGACLAIGTLASSLTQFQAVAFMMSMGGLLFLWLSTFITRLFTGVLVADVLNELALDSHFRSMVQRAVIDPIDIAYFFGMIAVSLFLATQVLSSRRWQA